MRTRQTYKPESAGESGPGGHLGQISVIWEAEGWAFKSFLPDRLKCYWWWRDVRVSKMFLSRRRFSVLGDVSSAHVEPDDPRFLRRLV